MQLNIILIKIYNSFVKLGVSLKKIGSDYGGSELPKLVSERLLMFVDLGGLSQFLFVHVITFPPLFCANNYYMWLLLIVCALR